MRQGDKAALRDIALILGLFALACCWGLSERRRVHEPPLDAPVVVLDGEMLPAPYAGVWYGTGDEMPMRQALARGAHRSDMADVDWTYTTQGYFAPRSAWTALWVDREP